MIGDAPKGRHELNAVVNPEGPGTCFPRRASR